MPNNCPHRIPIISYQPLPNVRSEEKRYPHHSATTTGTSDHQRKIPPEEYPRIYTDGSLSKTDRKAGAGIYSELFSYYIAAGSN